MSLHPCTLSSAHWVPVRDSRGRKSCCCHFTAGETEAPGRGGSCLCFRARRGRPRLTVSCCASLPLWLRSTSPWAGGAPSVNHLANPPPRPTPTPWGLARPGQQQTALGPRGLLEGLPGAVSTGQVGRGGPGWEVGAQTAPQGGELRGEETFLRAVSQILPSWGSQTQRQRKRQGAAEGKRNRGRDREK